METSFFLVLGGLALVNMVLLAILLLRRPVVDPRATEILELALERVERRLHDEIFQSRGDAAGVARQGREELASSLEINRQAMEQRLAAVQAEMNQKLRDMRETLEERLRQVMTHAQDLRQEVAASLNLFSETTSRTVCDLGEMQKTQLEGFSRQLMHLGAASDQHRSAVAEILANRLSALQEDSAAKLDLIRQASEQASLAMRTEVTQTLKAWNDSMVLTLTTLRDGQKREMEAFSAQLGHLSEVNQTRIEALKLAVEQRLQSIQEDNSRQLEQMRATVDEKLQGTLEKRLGESFRLVSERLEQVSNGLGEMKSLASGVGDLKRVLTNVKARGTWGEVQLAGLLEQVLAPDQYETHVATKGGTERVEFAIKLPGRSGDFDEVVWLPIDSKFPMEDYQRLTEAQERADALVAAAALDQLDIRIRQCARDISEKYLAPPQTTDFGILFLPTEGLYAEVLRRTQLVEDIRSRYQIVITGPTTLWSVLSSLRMGFRTLAIQKRSSEVWKTLSAVKTEWTKYGDILDKVQKKLQEASNHMDHAQRRNRAVGRKLRGVEALPDADEAQATLGLTPSTLALEDAEEEEEAFPSGAGERGQGRMHS